MSEINICNSAGRDAVVSTESLSSPKRVRYLDQENRQVSHIRVLKSTIDRDVSALVEQLGKLEDVADALVEGDPEIDCEVVGCMLRDVSRVYVDQHRKIVHRVFPWEIVHNPDGSERERRPRVRVPPNVAAETPLRWSGRYIQKSEAYRRFVFASKLQLMHINGLTYDFLYGIAKELHDRDSLMLLGAGPKSNQPLILRRGATAYRGFLEGRVKDDKYCLILHLSNMELKAPKE